MLQQFATAKTLLHVGCFRLQSANTLAKTYTAFTNPAYQKEQ